MARLGYVTVGSNDLPRAKIFYDALLGSAGVRPLWEHPSGGRIYGTDEGYFFCVVGPYDGKPATPGNGATFALQFDTRKEVDAFHATALMLGAGDEGAPGERAPTFYMSYFRDLDGNKLCAYCLGLDGIDGRLVGWEDRFYTARVAMPGKKNDRSSPL